MAKIHHLTLKSAVAKYSAFHLDGKSEQEVKAEIEKDDKGFDSEDVDAIYEAIVNAKGEENSKQYVVKTSFRDINNFSRQYQVGEDVSHFDKVRLAGMVKNNLVEEKGNDE